MVITYKSPNGGLIDLTPMQIDRLTAAGVWPRDSRGMEFCEVSHGLRQGTPTYTDEQVADLISQQR